MVIHRTLSCCRAVALFSAWLQLRQMPLKVGSRKRCHPHLLSQALGRKADGRQKFPGGMATRNCQIPEQQQPALLPL